MFGVSGGCALGVRSAGVLGRGQGDRVNSRSMVERPCEYIGSEYECKRVTMQVIKKNLRGVW